jgi:signal transduction histidine kinase
MRDFSAQLQRPPVGNPGLVLSETPAAEAPHSVDFDELLKVQEYERKRLGQELHDSTGQSLVALHLSVARLRLTEVDATHRGLLDEISETVRDIDQQIRALAFLHYPAELDDTGLGSSIQRLVRGFGRRTGIHTTFKWVGEPVSVGPAVSLCMLRVAQEALANVHRHSHALSVSVRLDVRADHLSLTISDNGVGMGTPGEHNVDVTGVGLESMRYRVETLKGSFRIKRLKHGTKICATVPLTAN